MLRSLFAGISGLRAHQQMMDVTGNNIANVNTAGFKSSQAVFEDTFSQIVRAAAAPRDNIGGTNPAQVGLGVRMAAITTNFAQGSAQSTGRNSDLMVSGDGFFVLRDGTDQMYSRSGAFSFDANGKLVNAEGRYIQGWNADERGVLDPNTPIEDVYLPVGKLLPPGATETVTVGGNLPADTPADTPLTQSITTYDKLGTPMVVTMKWTRTADTEPAEWTLEAGYDDGDTATVDTLYPYGPITFSTPGKPDVVDPVTLDTTTNRLFVSCPDIMVKTGELDDTGAEIEVPLKIDVTNVSAYSGKATIQAQKQNGSAMGSLTGFTISQEGTVIGTFSNGLKQTVAQVALANFNNATGLEKAGDSTYRAGVNSGLPQIGQPGTGGRGLLQSGSLEMSNVDLGQEFTNLIIAQRGFQANSKIISSSDELLQDLVNLKR